MRIASLVVSAIGLGLALGCGFLGEPPLPPLEAEFQDWIAEPPVLGGKVEFVDDKVYIRVNRTLDDDAVAAAYDQYAQQLRDKGFRDRLPEQAWLESQTTQGRWVKGDLTVHMGWRKEPGGTAFLLTEGAPLTAQPLDGAAPWAGRKSVKLESAFETPRLCAWDGGVSQFSPDGSIAGPTKLKAGTEHLMKGTYRLVGRSLAITADWDPPLAGDGPYERNLAKITAWSRDDGVFLAGRGGVVSCGEGDKLSRQRWWVQVSDAGGGADLVRQAGIVAERALTSHDKRDGLVLSGEPAEGHEGFRILVGEAPANPWHRWDAEFPLHLLTLLERDLPGHPIRVEKGSDLEAPIVLEVGN